MAYSKNNAKNAAKCETAPPALITWHVIERGEKNSWNRIGAAWSHEDGKGLTLKLDMPMASGRIVLRERASIAAWNPSRGIDTLTRYRRSGSRFGLAAAMQVIDFDESGYGSTNDIDE